MMARDKGQGKEKKSPEEKGHKAERSEGPGLGKHLRKAEERQGTGLGGTESLVKAEKKAKSGG